MKSNLDPFNDYPAWDTFEMMHTTSAAVRNDLLQIYERGLKISSGISVACFGSQARNEMLSYSDVDVLFFRDGDSPQELGAIDYMKRAIKALPYDKIDTPSTIISPRNVLEMAPANSPDAYIADCAIVASSERLHQDSLIDKARAILHSRELLEENLIFNYFFMRHQAAEKSVGGFPNLKYSNGGSRDFLFLDRAADYLSNNSVSSVSAQNKTPMIMGALSLLSENIENLPKLDVLFHAVNIINTAKNQVVELSKIHNKPFDGVLSWETLANLQQVYYPNFTIQQILRGHKFARSLITQAKDLTINTVDNYVDDDSETRLVKQLWEFNSNDPRWRERRPHLFSELANSSRWTTLATIACQDDAPADLLNTIAHKSLIVPGHSFTIRLIMKNPSTAEYTLRMLVQQERLALDDDVDVRYRQSLEKRLAMVH